MAKDGKRSAIKPPRGYAAIDLIGYTLTATHKLNDDEQSTYEEAITSKNKLKWWKAMNKEIESLMKKKLGD